MKTWIKPLRPEVGILAGLLAIVAFRISGLDVMLVVVASVFFITSATMVQNDWRDRFHDVRKAKTLAIEHEDKFLTLLIASWVICGMLIVLAAVQNGNIGVALILMAVIGLVYSETRQLLLVPLILVSLTAASPVLLPLAVAANSEKLLPLFLSAALIICAREITKDIDDKDIDGDYKWTIPLAIGEQRSRAFTSATLVLAVFIISNYSIITLPATLPLLFSAILLLRGSSTHRCRKFLDIGMILIIITLVASTY